ncbi:MFS transporter [Streptomyces albipurpureus]|uniref:MFS transporter n=1 Tax=Streptomyces albipurpureus TaxID=2897419 RepID=A0ABT0V1G3_9ACTN|nr:MFS transporter [Streptomyces sp. CWNU-1]MCM2393730.1 MFS transporter [Streptomyces sp. CWNU-1]
MTGSAHAPHPAPAGPEQSFDRRLITPLILGSVLNPINSSIIAVSLVPIGEAFHAQPSQTAWLVSALYLATAVGQPIVGRLIDIHGPRRLFLAGAGLVGIAGVLGVLAPDLGALIVARALLGLGTCAGYPAAMYLIGSEARRTGSDSPATVLTALAIANQTMAVIGPTLGGLLIGVGGWRATFAVNIPLSVACLVLGALRLPRAKARQEGGRPTSRLDFMGMALFATTLVTLLLFLMSPSVARWYLPALTAAAAAGLTVRELRTSDPFIDLRVLGGNLPLLTTYCRNLLAMIVGYGFLYGYAQWLGEGRGLSAPTVGLVLLPLFLAALIASAVGGRRIGVRANLVAGAVAQIAACVLLLVVHTDTAIWLLLAVALVMGLPQGLNGLALQHAVYHQADPEHMASSAGLLRTFTYLGAMISSAATAAFYRQGADTGGLRDLTVFMLVVAVLFLVTTLLDRTLSRVGAPRP